MALSFPGVAEKPHFEKISFRVNNKIFATYDKRTAKACVKMSLKDQDIFCLSDAAHIYPVPNKWGLQGWTFIEAKKVHAALFRDALKCAYDEISKKSLNK